MRLRIPESIRYQPFELLLAVMCLISSVSTLLGAPSDRSALYRLLPFWFVQTWALTLLIGSLALICGASSAVDLNGRIVIRRVPCYRFGLRLLGAGSLVYGATLFLAAGVAALTVGPIIFALSAACYIRHADITKRSRTRAE